jgi:diguanylate cyclase (GGDEF)-like protein
MKLDPDLQEIPVIFLTGRTGREEMLAGLRMGAHDYLSKPFDPAELIARVSAALRVARLQQQLGRRNAELDQLSRTDMLTGLHNRRHGEECLRAEVVRAQRSNRPLSLFMIDIDFFKKINDRYGHARGDTVLQEMARRLLAVLRRGDVAARWGGEEFLVVLPDTDTGGASQLGTRVLEAMRSRPIALGEHLSCPITVSLGIATAIVAEPEELLKRADDALYAAKEAGRDRFVTAT